MSIRRLAAAVAAVLLLVPTIACAASAAETRGWTTYRHPRHGDVLSFPGGLFSQELPTQSDEGRAYATSDGRAKLIVGSLENADGQDLATYRDFVLEQNYPNAEVDYRRTGKRFFVVSGRLGDQHFYQWATFMCSGRRIATWAMVYPDAERRLFDPIVEIVARSFRPGGGDGCEP